MVMQMMLMLMLMLMVLLAMVLMQMLLFTDAAAAGNASRQDKTIQNYQLCVSHIDAREKHLSERFELEFDLCNLFETRFLSVSYIAAPGRDRVGTTLRVGFNYSSHTKRKSMLP